MKHKILQLILIIVVIFNCYIIGYSLVYKKAIIHGDSMEPTFYDGDKVNCKKNPKKIEKYDIIGFYVDDVAIMHRVVFIGDHNGFTYYITKGDNNITNDFIPITKENIDCKVVK